MSAADGSCRRVGPHLAELALGILEGRARGGVLRHLDTCAACSHDAEQLTRTADLLVELSPPCAPPHDLGLAVLSRGPAKRAVRRRPIPRIAAAAAVALLLAGAGAGVSRLVASPAASSPQRSAAASRPSWGQPWSGGTTLSAALLSSAGAREGTISLSGRHPAWLVVHLTAARSSPVRCLLRTATGRVVDLGTFPPSASRWASALPVPADRASVAELVTPHGAVVARASLSW